jgi:hypothetical protein
MTVREGLGYTFNVVHPANDVYVNMRDYTSVSFMVFEVDGATPVAITFSDDTSGSNTAQPDVIDRYYAGSADQSNGVWHLTTQTAAETITSLTDGTEDLAIVHITDEQCPDGKPYVKCAATGAAVTAILHGLQEQRDPANLASPRV